MKPTMDVSNLIYTSAELATQHVALQEKIQSEPGFTWGIPDVDQYVLPMRGGDVALLVARPGHGKCLAEGTGVLMYNGTVKNVEDIVVGDILIGPDSKPRTVVSTTNGVGDLYKITPVKGDSFTVNGDHVLSLVMSSNNGSVYKSGDINNVSVLDYIDTNKKWKHHAKLYRSGVDWPKCDILLDPYFIGLWLGDGTVHNPDITTMEPEVVEYLKKEFDGKWGLEVKCGPRYRVRITGIRGMANIITKALKCLGILNNKKCIPKRYLINSRSIRLAVLAGLIDSDGSWSNKCLCITQKRKSLAEDITFLARSLGFAAYMREVQKKCVNNGVVGTYYNVTISGELSEIPSLVKRKQVPERKQVKNVLRTGFKVECIGPGKYFGFELGGPDGLFLLSDFTVTHNSTILSYLALTEAERIIARGTQEEETVVYVTWEGTVDDIYTGMIASRGRSYSSTDYWWGRVDIDAVRTVAVQHGILPITIIGFSTMRRSTRRLTLDLLMDSLTAISEGTGTPKRKIKLLCGDYLQLIPGREQDERADNVTKAIVGAKEIGIHFDFPSFFGAQAGRTVDDYRIKLPAAGGKDIQWSSAAEQTADKVFGLWMPWKTEEHGTENDVRQIEVYGTQYPILPNTLIMEMGKQRKEAGRRTWGMYLAPELLRLASLELNIDRADLGYAYGG